MHAFTKFKLTIVLMLCSSPVWAGSSDQRCVKEKELLIIGQINKPVSSPVELEGNFGQYCQNEDVLQSDGNNNNALSTYLKSRDVLPDDIGGCNNIGFVLEQKGDLNGAVTAYEQCIFLDSRNGAAHHRLAEIYILKGKLNTAIDEYKKALEITPDNPVIFLRLGKAYKKIGKFSEAAKSFEAAISLDESNLDPRRELVKLEIKRKNFLIAEKLCREILATNRDDQQERSRLIGILGRQQKYDELVLFLTEEINRHPDDSINYYRLGLVKESLNDFRSAINAFQKSISIKATANAYYAIARAWLSVPDINKAREALTHASRIDPKRQDINEMFELIDNEYGRIGTDSQGKISLKTKK